MGQHPQPTAKKAPSPAATAKKTSTPPCSISKKQTPSPRLPQQQQKSSDSQRSPPAATAKKHQQQKASLTKWIGCRKLHDFRPQRNRHDHPVVEGSKMLGFTRSSLTRVWKLQLKSKRFSRLVLLGLAEHWVLEYFRSKTFRDAFLQASICLSVRGGNSARRRAGLRQVIHRKFEKGSMATALEVAALADAPRWRSGNEQQHQNQ